MVSIHDDVLSLYTWGSAANQCLGYARNRAQLRPRQVVFPIGPSESGERGASRGPSANVDGSKKHESCHDDLSSPHDSKDNSLLSFECGDEYHSVALDGRRRLFTWGVQTARKPRLGHDGDGFFPGLVAFPEKGGTEKRVIRKVVCGRDHTVLLTMRGEVWGFGGNEKGQLRKSGGPAPVSMAKPELLCDQRFQDVAAGAFYTLLLETTGSPVKASGGTRRSGGEDDHAARTSGPGTNVIRQLGVFTEDGPPWEHDHSSGERKLPEGRRKSQRGVERRPAAETLDHILEGGEIRALYSGGEGLHVAVKRSSLRVWWAGGGYHGRNSGSILFGKLRSEDRAFIQESINGEENSSWTQTVEQRMQVADVVIDTDSWRLFVLDTRRRLWFLPLRTNREDDHAGSCIPRDSHHRWVLQHILDNVVSIAPTGEIHTQQEKGNPSGYSSAPQPELNAGGVFVVAGRPDELTQPGEYPDLTRLVRIPNIDGLRGTSVFETLNSPETPSMGEEAALRPSAPVDLIVIPGHPLTMNCSHGVACAVVRHRRPNIEQYLNAVRPLLAPCSPMFDMSGFPENHPSFPANPSPDDVVITTSPPAVPHDIYDPYLPSVGDAPPSAGPIRGISPATTQEHEHRDLPRTVSVDSSLLSDCVEDSSRQKCTVPSLAELCEAKIMARTTIPMAVDVLTSSRNSNPILSFPPHHSVGIKFTTVGSYVGRGGDHG